MNINDHYRIWCWNMQAKDSFFSKTFFFFDTFCLRSAILMTFDFFMLFFWGKVSTSQTVSCAHQLYTSAMYSISGARTEFECKLRIIVVYRINPRYVSFVIRSMAPNSLSFFTIFWNKFYLRQRSHETWTVGGVTFKQSLRLG